MKAILLPEYGPPEVMTIGDFPAPQPGPGELLVKVKASALNRADTLQRQGKYPPPKGASPIMGLEIAGEVEAVGPGLEEWSGGEKVCALLPGGGYAEYAVIPSSMAMSVPAGWSYQQAAAMPEVFLTAFQALDWIADLQAGERVLIHAGASGVGTAAIQIARAKGAEVWITASAAKHELCRSLGASHTIDYRATDFADYITRHTQGKGVNVILDFIAAPYFQQNLSSLAQDGRLVLLALMGGVHAANINLAPVLVKRLQILGSTLRSRKLDYKVNLCRALQDFANPYWAKGQLLPVIDSVFPWTEVVEAHKYMEANRNQGKIVLSLENE